VVEGPRSNRYRGAASSEAEEDRVDLDQADLDTETFSNSRGWTAVRVTHRPSSIRVERSRSRELPSAVQAQKECIEEIERILSRDGAEEPEVDAPAQGHEHHVSREEFEALVARVAALECGTGLGG